jgi:hypothetical protein
MEHKKGREEVCLGVMPEHRGQFINGGRGSKNLPKWCYVTYGGILSRFME